MKHWLFVAGILVHAETDEEAREKFLNLKVEAEDYGWEIDYRMSGDCDGNCNYPSSPEELMGSPGDQPGSTIKAENN